MTEPRLTNEMKRHAVMVALKSDHGDLEIVHFLKVARLFDHKIRKKLEKENENVKNIPHVPIQWEHPNLFIKLSKKTDENRGQSMRSIEKTCLCLKRQSEGLFMKTFDSNPM